MMTRIALMLSLAVVLGCGNPPPTQGGLAELTGKWQCVADANRSIEFQGGIYRVMLKTEKGSQVAESGTASVDSTKKPMCIDIKINESTVQTKGKTYLGIYEPTGTKLRICHDTDKRPTEFSAAKAGGAQLFEYESR